MVIGRGPWGGVDGGRSFERAIDALVQAFGDEWDEGSIHEKNAAEAFPHGDLSGLAGGVGIAFGAPEAGFDHFEVIVTEGVPEEAVGGFARKSIVIRFEAVGGGLEGAVEGANQPAVFDGALARRDVRGMRVEVSKLE